jgi:hypothetical protein
MDNRSKSIATEIDVTEIERLKAGLKTMAADHLLPGGRRMLLTRLVRSNLPWFVLARDRGLTWGDMGAALASVGILSPAGKPVSIGALSSAVWRAVSAADVGAKVVKKEKGSKGSDARKNTNSMSPKYAEPSIASNKRMRPVPTKNVRSTNHVDTLSYMKRAKNLRRQAD